MRAIISNLHGRAAGDDEAAFLATLRSQVDEIIRVFHDIEIVFDGDNRVTHFHEAMENVDELLYVGEVKAGGGFVQYVECFPMRLLPTS